MHPALFSLETLEATLVLHNFGPSISVGLVDVLVNLLAALDKIQGSDEGVGGTAGKDTSESASVVVLSRVQGDLLGDLGLGLLSACERSSQESAPVSVRVVGCDRPVLTSSDGVLGSFELVLSRLQGTQGSIDQFKADKRGSSRLDAWDSEVRASSDLATHRLDLLSLGLGVCRAQEARVSLRCTTTSISFPSDERPWS